MKLAYTLLKITTWFIEILARHASFAGLWISSVSWLGVLEGSPLDKSA